MINHSVRLTAVRFRSGPELSIPASLQFPASNLPTCTPSFVHGHWQIFIFALTYLSFLAISFLFRLAFLCHVYWCVKVIKSNWTLVTRVIPRDFHPSSPVSDFPSVTLIFAIFFRFYTILLKLQTPFHSFLGTTPFSFHIPLRGQQVYGISSWLWKISSCDMYIYSSLTSSICWH